MSVYLDRPGLRDHIWDAMHSLRAFRLRTLLALIGVVIGTAAVVALFNIARNAAAESLRGFVNMGSNIIVVQFPWTPGTHAPMPKKMDMLPLLQRVPELAGAVSLATVHVSQERRGVNTGVRVIGVSGDFSGILGITLAQGRFLNRFDKDATFAVAGGNVPHMLADHRGVSLALGSFADIGTYRYQIVGITQVSPSNPLLPVDFSNTLAVPLDSVRRFAPEAEITHIVARIKNGAQPEQAAASLRVYLQRLLPERQVELLVPHLLLETQRHQGRLFTYLLTGLGGIVLLVSGAGIMNVILISVTERQREIGLRLALGARREDIRTLFLIEAVVISLCGALIGGVFGVAAAWGYARFSSWQFVFQWDALPLGIGCALLTGVFFGWYPAGQAARLTPALAMREDH